MTPLRNDGSISFALGGPHRFPAVLDGGDQVAPRDPVHKQVVAEDLGEQRLVREQFLLCQVEPLERLQEGEFGRREDGEGSLAGQRLGRARGVDDRGQRREGPLLTDYLDDRGRDVTVGRGAARDVLDALAVLIGPKETRPNRDGLGADVASWAAER